MYYRFLRFPEGKAKAVDDEDNKVREGYGVFNDESTR